MDFKTQLELEITNIQQKVEKAQRDLVLYDGALQAFRHSLKIYSEATVVSDSDKEVSE